MTIIPDTSPNFGPNVIIFDPSYSMDTIQSQINAIYSIEQNAQFGAQRYALLFKPGVYPVDIPAGFYTEFAGLRANPDAVQITENLHSDAYLPGNNATCNFWRGATNFSVAPNNGLVKWSVSQAVRLNPE